MPLIEKRYAEALIDLSVQDNTIDEYQQDLSALAEAFVKMQDFRLFLLNPEINVDIKKKAVQNAFNGKINKKLVDFILLLLDKSRIVNLPGITVEFIKAADKIRNTIDITIISAIPLAEEQVGKIVEKYKNLYKSSNAKLHLETDKSLIGGVKVKIGDKIADGSITGRLQDLREILIES